ncbi:MAG TPA: GAF domain-containing protein, partial [Polyangia bacterium]|nr:GAF domain-containing protein [Polyangia bacterium]
MKSKSKGKARLSEHLGYHAGRLFRAALAFAVCGAFLVLFWRGWFPDLRLPGADLRRVGAAAVLTALLVFKISARVRTSERRRTPRREAISDAELGLLLLTTVYLLLAFWGGVTSPVYPLVYAVVSFLVTFHRLWVGLPLAATAIGFEAVLSFGPTAPPEAAGAFPGHVVFIVVFALLNVVFLHAEVARQRRERRRRLEGEVAAMREEARDFRLIATALSSESRVRTRAEEQEKLSQGSIQTIHQQLYYNLALLRSALQLQTCALLWLDETGERLKVKELCSDSPHIAEGAIAAGGGVLGAILKEMHPFVLEAPRLSLLPYYGGPATVGAFVGVPVVEGRAPRGILVGDRAGDRKFDDAAVALMASAAEQVVRVVQSERVFQAVERSKHEHERFYRASAELNRALTLDEVYAAAIAGARGVCEFEFAAIATYDARRGSHTIRSVVGESAEHLLGTTHKD